MSFSKVYGPLTIAESGGVATISLSINEAAGGAVPGFASAKVSAEASISAAMLIDAGLGLIADKFPSIAPELAAFKALVDAEVAKA